MEKLESKNKLKSKMFYEKIHEHIKKNIKEKKKNSNNNYNKWQRIMIPGKLKIDSSLVVTVKASS